VELFSTSSLLEASWCFFVNCIIIIVSAAPSIVQIVSSVQACFLHCCYSLNLVRLTVTNSFILLSLLLELLSLPFLRRLIQQFVPSSLPCSWFCPIVLLFVDWEPHPIGHISPQYILACDHPIGHAHGHTWHFQLVWFLFCWVWVTGGMNFRWSLGLVWIGLDIVVSFSGCLIPCVASCFLYFWVQGGLSFEPIYWPFVGGLVGTISNFPLDTGLLQFFQLTQAPVKGSGLWLPSGQRWAIKAVKGFVLACSPQPWVPKCTQLQKPDLCRCIYLGLVWHTNEISKVKGDCFGRDSNLLLHPWFASNA